MKIFHIFFLIFILNIFLYAKVYEAKGYGKDIKEARDNAMQTLCLSFMANVKSKDEKRKESNRGDFEQSFSTHSSIECNLGIPRVNFTKEIYENNHITITAFVEQKDILNFIENTKIKHSRDLNGMSDDELIEIEENIKEIEKLVHILNFEDKNSTILFFANKISNINTLLESCTLYKKSNVKKFVFYLDNEKMLENKLTIKRSKKYKIKATKNGYHDINKNIKCSLETNKKNIRLDFIKNKDRKIFIDLDIKYLKKLENFLEEFKINNSKSSKITFKIYFDKTDINKKRNINFAKVYGHLNIKKNKKYIKKQSISKKKTSRKSISLDKMKLEIIKQLIKDSLLILDER